MVAQFENGFGDAGMFLSQKIFEGGAEVGFVVAVFDDYGSVKAEAPCFALGVAFAFADCARAGHDDGVFRNDEGKIGGGAKDRAIHKIEQRGSAGEDGAGGEHSAFADNGAFVDAAVSADEDVVLDNDWAGVDGFEDAADLRCGTQVNAFADLRAGADQGVRVDQRALVDIRADVDIHGRHADDAAGQVRPGANRRAAGNYAHAVAGCEPAGG